MLRSERRTARVRQVLSARQTDLTVVLENIHDPHNVSAIMRTCDAAGVLRAELLYDTEPFPRIGRKSSSSAHKWIDRRKHRSVEDCFSVLRSEGFHVYAATLTETARSVFDLDLTVPAALVFGNEHRGVSERASALADAAFKVPMLGMIESLNVSVACAVALYEAVRQRLGKPSFPARGLDAARMEGLMNEWLKK